MKFVFRLLLLAATCLLVYLCYKSIIGNIEFDRESGIRDRAVIQRLVDIRTAQVAFRSRTGSFADDFAALTNFVKNGQMATVRRVGELTEAQLEDGMTEVRAMEIIRRGNEREIRTAGLWNERTNAPQLERDSIFTSAREVLFPNRPNFSPDSLAYVPFGQGTRFELAVDTIWTQAGPLQVFQAQTPYETYLSDLDSRLLQQKIQAQLDRPGERYAGMRVGSLTQVVNNAGNWE
jgi:hypothetical protein